MKTENYIVHAKRQGRESNRPQLRLYHRSLSAGPGQVCLRLFGLAPLRLCLKLAVFAAVLILPTVAVCQEVEDTIRIKTRVVFLDALVKEKKTGLPISNLTPDSFEVYDEGKPRKVSYFTREGKARKPLALILILDLRDDGAGRFLKRPEILKAMEDELAKLPPEDEVAILAMDINGEDEKRVWLAGFTRADALIVVAL